jgi:hypothetical protein
MSHVPDCVVAAIPTGRNSKHELQRELHQARIVHG